VLREFDEPAMAAAIAPATIAYAVSRLRGEMQPPWTTFSPWMPSFKWVTHDLQGIHQATASMMSN